MKIHTLFLAVFIAFAICTKTNAEEIGVTVTTDDPNFSVEEIFVSFSTGDDDILITPIQITDLNAYVINLSTNAEFKLSLGTTGDPYIAWEDSQTPGSETRLYWQGISTMTVIKFVENDFYQVYNTAKTTGTFTGPTVILVGGNIDTSGDDITFEQTEVLPEPSVGLLLLIGASTVAYRRRKS